MKLATLFIIGCFAWLFLNARIEARRERQRNRRNREVNAQRYKRLWVVDDPDTGMITKGRQFHTDLYDQDNQ